MPHDRRDFLSATGASVVGTLATAAADQPRAANERIVVGVIGCGGMGMNHVRRLARRNDVRVAYVCDVDRNRAAGVARVVNQATRQNPQIKYDLRQVLDQNDVDAVFIATPDHWHGPAAILAASAGKHVYVEKPCSHNIREGGLMIEAARAANKVMQVGTQSRSTQHVQTAIGLLHQGEIGDVLGARAWNSQKRRNIGHAQPGTAPRGLDYDMWVGPAPMVPYQSNRLHYTWHWWYNFGTGDMGNDGVHDIDIARWGLNVNTHPSTVTAVGGKYFFDDDQQFPDTQTVIFEYPGNGRVGQKRQLIFEQRIWSPYHQEGFENGMIFYGTRGTMLLGKGGGWKVFRNNREVRSMAGNPDIDAHHSNFFSCVRDGNRPNADIGINHFSTTLCHLGNIATRLGRTLQFDPEREVFVGDEEANNLVCREYRRGHWAVPRGAERL